MSQPKAFFPLKRDLKKIKPIHVKSLAIEVKLEAESKGNKTTLPVSIPARVILNDFTEKTVVFFSTRAIQAETALTIELDDPLPLRIKARVYWCREVMGMGRTLSDHSFRYRVAVVFEFPEAEAEKTDAQQKLTEFLKKTNESHLSFHRYE